MLPFTFLDVYRIQILYFKYPNEVLHVNIYLNAKETQQLLLMMMMMMMMMMMIQQKVRMMMMMMMMMIIQQKVR